MQQVWLVLWLARLPLLAAEAGTVSAEPPALAVCVSSETSRYRVRMGMLGEVGELTLQFAPAPPATLLRAVATGRGSVLGLGKSEQRIESELDARQWTARRWTNVRSNGNGVTTDTGEQSQPGTVALLRKRSNEADQTGSFTRTLPIFDPVSFLLHLRADLPSKPTTYEMLDGRALWLVSTSPSRLGPDTHDLWRVDGKLEPIFWDGSPDRERKTFSFSMFFANDRFHTLTKLTVPFGLGDIHVDLVAVERIGPRDLGRALYCRPQIRPGIWGVLAALAETMRASVPPAPR